MCEYSSQYFAPFKRRSDEDNLYKAPSLRE